MCPGGPYAEPWYQQNDIPEEDTMYSYELTKQVAESRRQELMAEARADRLAKVVRTARQPRTGVRVSLRRAFAR
jgi:hypothetical protein